MSVLLISRGWIEELEENSANCLPATLDGLGTDCPVRNIRVRGRHAIERLFGQTEVLG